MRRTLATLTTTALFLALTAATAIAQSSGEGLVESNDRTVTAWALGVIGFFPLFILCASLLQWQLEKRKDRRKAAATRQAQTDPAVWSGGW